VAARNIVLGPGSKVRPGSAFEILADQKLDALRQPYAPAFAAACAERQSESFFAIVSDQTLPPRYELVEKLASLRLDHVLTPVGWGLVDLPGLPAGSFATVFERPAGERVVGDTAETLKPLTADEILHTVLPPIVRALHAFADARITHRAIRPTNLFYHGPRREMLLGDAVSAPPGYAQPDAFETVEGAMAAPHCRGAGTPSDDLYALGVTLVYLLLARDPTAGTDPRELLRAKIERGSFMTIIGQARLPPELIEILRGLLADDGRERWTIEDVENWMQGRRLKPRQQNPSGIVATRPFDFNGRGSYTARAVAHAFAGDPPAAARAIRSTDFEIWLQRSLADETRSVAVAAVRADGGELRTNAGQDLRLTARTCIALDPLAPIRYGDFSIAIDSFGNALIAAFNCRGSLQTIGEILTARLPQFWMSAQTNLKPEIVAMNAAKPFETIRRLAEDPRLGFGLERVLYELNPMIHCLSPLIQADHVVEAPDILDALERAAERGVSAETLLDRHLAAFIAARARHLPREALDFLSGSARQRALGTLAILAHLQGAHGPVTLPALGKFIASQASTLVDMFHSRERRTRLLAEVNKLANRGSLSDLFWLLNGSTERSRDMQGFAAAQQEFATVERALAVLRRGEHTRPAEAAELGGSAGVISAAFAAVVVGFIAVIRAW
jgi:eukaryotic-like serine/threonine-protein kinase